MTNPNDPAFENWKPVPGYEDIYEVSDIGEKSHGSSIFPNNWYRTSSQERVGGTFMLDPNSKAIDLDVRSYFAAMAMQGILANATFAEHGVKIGPYNDASRGAIAVADALIAELNK